MSEGAEGSGPGGYLISCGGTGGHLAPGIALAEELVARGHRATLLISEKPVDTQLAAKYSKLHFTRVPGAPFSVRPGALLRFVVKQGKGLRVALRLVRSERPQAIIGFGGFTNAAIVLAGAFHHVPVALHEANRVPGRAVRRLAAFAQRVYLPPGVRLSTRSDARWREVGLPLRREIQPLPRDEARRRLGLDPSLPVVAVLGGSQGATGLNAWAATADAVLSAQRVQLYVVTGQRRPGADAQGSAGSALFRSVPFCDQMATLLSAADVVVSRAGAGTIAELVRCRTPSILVPYPFAADNHQAANARHLVEQGGALLMEQGEVAERMTGTVRSLLQDEQRRQRMRDALAALDQVNAVQRLADDLETLGPARGRGQVPAGRPAAA